MRMTVTDVMTSKVVSVTATTAFKDIAETLITGGISAVPVVDDDGAGRRPPATPPASS
ncbi:MULTISPECIES: CBS domain-containing protein [unclassified Nonomuraea]|uniref:CBS domain-containing protein n=1 Tax=unclassified Nonomuraea TaxID=2593643 RepID=UPI0035BEDB50